MSAQRPSRQRTHHGEDEIGRLAGWQLGVGAGTGGPRGYRGFGWHRRARGLELRARVLDGLSATAEQTLGVGGTRQANRAQQRGGVRGVLEADEAEAAVRNLRRGAAVGVAVAVAVPCASTAVAVPVARAAETAADRPREASTSARPS